MMGATIRIAGLAALLCLPLGLSASAQVPGTIAADPRFTLQPVEGGVLKLDTRTGALSFCSTTSGVWTCKAVPEDRAALEAEIARLNARIAELEKTPSGVPDIMGPPAAPPPAAAPAPEATPPQAGRSDDVTPEEARKRLDQAMDMAEHVFRRFFDMVDRLRGREPAPDDQGL